MITQFENPDWKVDYKPVELKKTELKLESLCNKRLQLNTSIKVIEQKELVIAIKIAWNFLEQEEIWF